MTEKTTDEIETKIRNANSISDDRKRELLQLLATLRIEIGKLSKAHDEHAQSIAGFAKISALEAMRKNQNAQSLKHSLAGLRASVDGFEQSHPQLVQIVNTISNTLSNLGI